MAKYAIAHYHEIALKGRNRPFFIDCLLANIRRVLAGVGLRQAISVHNSVLLELDDDVRWDEARSRLQRVFGLATFSLVERSALDLDAIKAATQRAIDGKSFQTFRVTARRADKRFPLTSEQLNRELGTFVQSVTHAPVSLKQPDLTVYVEILSREALVYAEKVPGPGGLPVGSGGRVAVLLSGGIDSPVAAYRLLRRGCRVTFVHFHSHPFLDASSKQKAQELVELLDDYQGNSRLYLVPFGEVQRQIVLTAPAPYRTVLYRRFMVRFASRIARAEGAGALVTGESLGQVASQTLENMAVVEAASDLPVLRPLVGMDKLEIVRQAEHIGTFPISIQPDQDCCQLFMPRDPVTHATPAAVARAERPLDLDQLAALALSDLEVVDYRSGSRHKERRSLLEGVDGHGPRARGQGETVTPTSGGTSRESMPAAPHAPIPDPRSPSPGPRLVSACLAGFRCRYDGQSKADPRIVEMVRRGEAIPVCPEQLGGLPTPREPSVFVDDTLTRLETRTGQEVTSQFEQGAEEVARLARTVGAQEAILQERSPSCGTHWVYQRQPDGTEKLVPGQGVTARRLQAEGLRVVSSEE